MRLRRVVGGNPPMEAATVAGTGRPTAFGGLRQTRQGARGASRCFDCATEVRRDRRPCELWPHAAASGAAVALGRGSSLTVTRPSMKAVSW
jgi:hypothetical protein